MKLVLDLPSALVGAGVLALVGVAVELGLKRLQLFGTLRPEDIGVLVKRPGYAHQGQRQAEERPDASLRASGFSLATSRAAQSSLRRSIGAPGRAT